MYKDLIRTCRSANLIFCFVTPSLWSSWFALSPYLQGTKINCIFVFLILFSFGEGWGGCKPKQCNEFKSLICVYSQLERLDQLFEEEPFLLLAGIKCTSPWPVTMVTTTLNMVSLQTIYVRKNWVCLPLENIIEKITSR